MTHNEITEKLGMPSGTLVHIGDIHARQSRISVTHYNKDQYDIYRRPNNVKANESPCTVLHVQIFTCKSTDLP